MISDPFQKAEFGKQFDGLLKQMSFLGDNISAFLELLEKELKEDPKEDPCECVRNELILMQDSFFGLDQCLRAFGSMVFTSAHKIERHEQLRLAVKANLSLVSDDPCKVH